MAEKEQNFEMWIGDSKEIDFVVTMTGVLSSATIKWGLSTGKNTVPLFSKTSTSGISVSGNTATVIVNPVDTTSLRPGRYYHELEITDGNGDIFTAAIGQVWLKAAIIK